MQSAVTPTRPAGFLRRTAAACYDLILLLVVWYAATFLVLPFTHGEAVAPHRWWYSAYLFAVGYLYFGWCWTRGGQTLGLRAWHLRVVDRSGSPVGWRQALARYLGAWVSTLSFGLGFLWLLADRERCAWHDRLAGTRVVYHPAGARVVEKTRGSR